jgi:hypothetical protein
MVGAWRARWIGFVGVLFCVVGSYGAGGLSVHDPTAHWPLLGRLRHGAGPQVALTFVYIGVAVVLVSWLFLGRVIRSPATAPRQRELLTTCAWWGIPLLLSIPLFSRDMWSYAAQAHLTASGLDPYKAGPDQMPGPYLDEVQRVWVDSPAPYGPLWLTAGRLIGMAAGNHVYVTAFSMRLLSCVGVVLLAVYLPRLAQAFGADPRMATWLVLANPLLLLHFISGGHNDALMLGLGIAGLTLVVERRRWALGVVLVTLGIAVKAPVALILAFCVPVYAAGLDGPRAWWRSMLRIGAVSIGTFAVVTVASGFGLGWVSHLNTAGDLVSWVSVSTGLALLGAHVGHLLGFGDLTDALVAAFRVAGEVVAGTLAVLLWIGVCRQQPINLRRAARALGISLTMLVLLGPIVQPWYLLWPITVLAIVGLTPRWQTVIGGVTVWASLLVTPQGATLFDRPIAVLAAAVAAVVGAVVVLGPHDWTQTGPRSGRSSTPLATTKT